MRYPTVYETLRKFAPLPRTEWARAEALGVEQSIPKRGHFVRPGDPADRIGVVLEGLFRAVRFSPHGEESVKSFRAEHELIGPYAEQLQGIASLTAVEALEPSRVLTFKVEAFQSLEAHHPAWIQLARRVAEYHFVVKERREQEFLELSAEDRLGRFWAEHPHLEGRLAQRDVAAYLGVTEVGLSRIVTRRKRQSR
jgi:CRP-like cAMP-binding protein